MIQKRLHLLILLFLIGYVFIGSLGLAGTWLGVQSMHTAYFDRLVPLQQLNTLYDAYGAQVQNVVIRLNNGEIPADEGIALIQAIQDTIRTNWEQYNTIPMTPIEKRHLHQADTLMHIADQEIDNTLQLIQVLRSQGQGLLANQLNMIIGSLNPAVHPVLRQLDSLSYMHLELTRKSYQEAQNRGVRNLLLMILFLLLFLISGVYWANRFRSRLAIQLQEIIPSLQKIGQGNLKARISYIGKDELGMIATGINDMAYSLNALVAKASLGAATLKDSSLELHSISEKILTHCNATSLLSHQIALSAKDCADHLNFFITLISEEMEERDVTQASHLIHMRDRMQILREENMNSIVQAALQARQTLTLANREINQIHLRATQMEEVSRQLAHLMGAISYSKSTEAS
ncbi:MAG TPA: methyl-accepting chemotaxis protein [Fibrobacteraceae bacterium]|nr:methyl-accepting chemotaxis protein [Fibrobacteraceae bacterium]